jgi:hypothetical protein
MSKGSNRRQQQISDKEMAERWEETFGASNKTKKLMREYMKHNKEPWGVEPEAVIVHGELYKKDA